MATCTLNTTVSRRAMLGVAALAAGGGSASAGPLTLPSPTGGEGSSAACTTDPDAELLRLMALARRRRKRFNAARLAALRRFRAMVGDPDYPRRSEVVIVTDAIRAKRDELAERSGYRAAMARRGRARDAYMAAAKRAFAIPPRTLAGLRAKLHFARRSAREGDDGNYDYGDNIWLDIVTADLDRLAAA